MLDFSNLTFLDGVLSVLILNVVSNLISLYVNPRADSLFSTLSSRLSLRWQKRTTKKKKEFEALVQMLRSDPTEQLLAASDVLGYKVMGLVNGVMSFLCLSIFLGNSIYRRIGEEAFKNSLSSLDLIGPVVSSAPSKLTEYFYLLLTAFFMFMQIQEGFRGLRLATAISEARRFQTPERTS